MADQLVRQDVWTLEQERLFHPIILAYALAVREMRTRPSDPPPAGTYQTAVHWTNEPDPGPFFNQCQHNTWFFLPWHRMFLYWFERIVRSVLQRFSPSPRSTSRPEPPGRCPTGTTGTPDHRPPPSRPPSRTACRPRSGRPPSPTASPIRCSRRSGTAAVPRRHWEIRRSLRWRSTGGPACREGSPRRTWP